MKTNTFPPMSNPIDLSSNQGRGEVFNKGRRNAFSRGLRTQIFILTLGAAAMIISVLPYRFSEDIFFGGFFSLIALLQIVFCFDLVFRPSRALFRYAFIGTLGLMVIWIAALTIGLPFGPFAHRAEPVSIPDILTLLFSGVSLLMLAPLAWRVRPPKPSKLWRVILVTIPTVLLASIFTFLGVVTGINGLPFAMNMGMAPMDNMASIDMRSLVEKPGNQPVKSFTLTAEVAQVNGHTVWTYNHMLPGPELRVTQGDRLKVTLVNHLPVSTSIHWHGIRLPNAEDGVAGVTQDAVAPGASYTYEFVVKDAGTFWYHSHQQTETQLPRGLYGALIVAPKEQSGQRYDRDYTVMIGDLSDNENTNQILVNGTAGDYHLDARPGEMVRLRIINADQSYMLGTPEITTLVGAPYKVIALDGNDLNHPQEIGPKLLQLGMGQRMDLAFRMPASGQVKLFDIKTALSSKILARNETVSLGGGSAPSVPDVKNLSTFDFATYGLPASDPIAARTSFDVNQDLHISNVHWFRYGSFENVHMINGKASPYTDPITVRLGQVVHLRFINETEEYHPMHLHGHFFTILAKNGTRLSGSPVHLDSILVGPHETWDVAFLADNPGLWMIHCHVLLHAAFGLSMMINYEGVTTPYVIGTKSGNFPE